MNTRTHSKGGKKGTKRREESGWGKDKKELKTAVFFLAQ
jgi:hypothetical protein